MTTAREPKVCGRCGVYRHLHPVRECTKPRPEFWWDRHRPVRHLVGLVWLALPEKVRWAWVQRVNERHPTLCWCDLVDCAMLADRKADYRSPWMCGCDVPRPWRVGEPRIGECYCPPREVTP